ncbi:partial [Paramuricea clavata]|uniref:Partial n=1 Tax=Paramuricea clavata TaxID=317549 RepID=A0A6S7GDJ8_PARCT|nr:partial [Paramuricea clavata]
MHAIKKQTFNILGKISCMQCNCNSVSFVSTSLQHKENQETKVNITKVQSTMATVSDTAPVKAVKQWEMLLECSICTETLTQPRTLSCFHSFCKHCLGNFVAAHRKKAAKAKAKAPEVFECPVCRTEFHVKEGESVDKMPSNHFINNMLELLTLQQQAEDVKCQSCRAKNPAMSRCISCENYLCEKCMEVHKTWLPFEHHIVLTLEELAKPENRAKARAKPRCEKHDKVLKFYCETCKALVCRYCVDVSHARLEHLWFPLADVVVQYKEALKTSSAIFEQQMNEAVQSNLKIEHAIGTLKNNTTKAKAAIMYQQEEILNAFTKKLEEETVVLLDQADMTYNEANEPLLKQQADVKAFLEKTKSSLDFAENIITNGSDEEIISLKYEVEEKAGNIEKERPELMNPVHNDAIEYQAKPTEDVLENVKWNNIGKIARTRKFEEHDILATKERADQILLPLMPSRAFNNKLHEHLQNEFGDNIEMATDAMRRHSSFEKHVIVPGGNSERGADHELYDDDDGDHSIYDHNVRYPPNRNLDENKEFLDLQPKSQGCQNEHHDYSPNSGFPSLRPVSYLDHELYGDGDGDHAVSPPPMSESNYTYI